MEENIEILEEIKDILVHLKNYGWINDIKKDIDTNKSIQAIENVVNRLKELDELKKYDYRNIKINKEDKIESINFTKEQLDLMNLGIALYLSIPKLMKDEGEEDNI